MATLARPDSGMAMLPSLDDIAPYLSQLRALLSGLPTTLPEPAQQAAKYLLNMFKIEYQVRKNLIAGLSDADALFALKAQFPKYINGLYPFNLLMNSLEKPADWWARVG